MAEADDSGDYQKKPKEYDPTEATAHMKSKKKFWIKKKKKYGTTNL